MSKYNYGWSDLLIYDRCAYEQQLRTSIAPMDFHLYDGKYENTYRCKDGEYFTKQQLVDYESELKNITRVNSLCASKQYNPSCSQLDRCISTTSAKVPRVLSPDLCPVVTSNIGSFNFRLKK